MEKILLRGYVTPEDFEGSDTQRLQQALDAAVALDIRKVVLTGSYVAEESLVLPGGLHLELRPDARLTAQLETPLEKNYSFARQWLCIDGGGCLEGSLQLFNCAHVTVENITVSGSVFLEFCRWVRMEKVQMKQLQVGRGCSECIFQKLTTQVVMDLSQGSGVSVMGIDPTVRSVILRDCQCLTDAPALTLLATQEAGFQNLLADGLTAKDTAVQIGHATQHTDPRRYWGLTLIHLNAPWKVCSRTPLVQSLVE